ncbi:MAG: FMN-binding protein [Endomicrobium sp.]|jgi:major membrane immunogen (membrane-anchored lipoprotein)|nr:FMN-binding protein [Endomicrobium sp.]
MLKKYVRLHALAALFLLYGLRFAYGASYNDGTYVAVSGKDDRGAYGEVSLTIEQNKITDCVFVTYQKDGKIKGEDYGKVNGIVANADYYDKAQLAVNAMKTYANQLVETQKLGDVDVIAGATVAYDQFVEAAEEAFNQAKKGKK